MSSTSQMSCSRNPRFLPLTRLDVDLALGKVKLAGDALADDELSSMFDRDDKYDPYFDDPYDVMRDWWALEDDNDDFDPVPPPEPHEEAWPDWGYLED